LGITIFPNTRIGRGISVVTYNSNANKVEWRFFNFLERDLSKLNYSYAPYSANMDDANSFSFGSDDGSFLSFWHKKFVLLKKLGLLSVSSEEWGFTILTNTIDSTYEDLKLHNPNYDDYFYENQAKKIERAGCEIRYRLSAKFRLAKTKQPQKPCQVIFLPGFLFFQIKERHISRS
jgi:hypothetical protein